MSGRASSAIFRQPFVPPPRRRLVLTKRAPAGIPIAALLQHRRASLMALRPEFAPSFVPALLAPRLVPGAVPGPVAPPDCVAHRGLDLVPAVIHEGLELVG